MRRRVAGFTLEELATGRVLFDWGAAVAAVLSWIVGHVADVASAVWAALKATWGVVQPIFKHVWGALQPIWNDVLKPFWGKLQTWFGQLKTWWNRWAKPVTDFLSHVEKFERTIYAATFGPILDTISNLQKLLVVLHLSHTALGQALANALQHIDQTVTTVYTTITDPINQVIFKIDGYILDLDGFLSAPLLAISISNHFKAVWSAWWIRALPQVSDEAKRVLEAAKLHQAVADHRTRFKLADDRSSPWAPAFEHGKAILELVANAQEPPQVNEQDDGTFA
jgi:hypothetical protein